MTFGSSFMAIFSQQAQPDCNDAIGNLAVVVAAVLVWWLASPWPDLLMAFAVAALFLQSAWSIIRDACHDLSQAGRA
jgi:Co/Zn/Cd efflux system component